VNVDAKQWLVGYAEALGVQPPSDSEIDDLLALAGVAAHASERTAAPVSCWLAASAGKSAVEALTAAREVAAAFGDAVDHAP
jgi:hypothetical protein